MMSDSIFQQLQSKIQEKRIIDQTVSMVKIRSENPFSEPVSQEKRELEMANYLQHELEVLGLKTMRQEIRPERPNVWGMLTSEKEGPTLLLAAHLDTVGIDGYKEALNPKIENGRIYGAGLVI